MKISTVIAILAFASASVVAVAVPVENNIDIDRRGAYYTPSSSTSQCFEIDVNGRCRGPLQRRGYYTPSPSPSPTGQCAELDVDGRCQENLHRRGYYTASPSPESTSGDFVKNHRRGYYTPSPAPSCSSQDVNGRCDNRQRRGYYIATTTSINDTVIAQDKVEHRGAYYTAVNSEPSPSPTVTAPETTINCPTVGKGTAQAGCPTPQP
ncbi:hypothetical protein HDU97_007553 [Phlyctochytrium planicorne]|nr:hypothetical protein HDU97_007553 [Phlyctochytrium planicorne]